MSGNHLVIVKIHPRRMTLPRDGRHRRLTMEQLEYRWLLSVVAGTPDWPTAASAVDYATTWPTVAPTPTPASYNTATWPIATSAVDNAALWPTAAPAIDNTTAWPTNASTAVSAAAWPKAVPSAGSVTTTQVAAPAAASTAISPAVGTAASAPAAASSANCGDQSGWVDVGPSGSGNSGSDSGYQNNPSSSWSSSGADQLPAKKPVQLLLSPDLLSAHAADEGGLVDLTPISNQPTMTLLASAATSGDGASNAGGDAALRPLSGATGALPAVKLDGLRGSSQAFDVAVSPVLSYGDGPAPEDPPADLKFHPATVWPMPNLRPDSGGIPSASTLRDFAPPAGDGKTTFAPRRSHRRL